MHIVNRHEYHNAMHVRINERIYKLYNINKFFFPILTWSNCCMLAIQVLLAKSRHNPRLLFTISLYFKFPSLIETWICSAWLGKGVKIGPCRVRAKCRMPRRVRKEVWIRPRMFRAPRMGWYSEKQKNPPA